jgi:hypothetical protein
VGETFRARWLGVRRRGCGGPGGANAGGPVARMRSQMKKPRAGLPGALHSEGWRREGTRRQDAVCVGFRLAVSGINVYNYLGLAQPYFAGGRPGRVLKPCNRFGLAGFLVCNRFVINVLWGNNGFVARDPLAPAK